jgi:hypothetical protein
MAAAFPNHVLHQTFIHQDAAQIAAMLHEQDEAEDFNSSDNELDEGVDRPWNQLADGLNSNGSLRGCRPPRKLSQLRLMDLDEIVHKGTTTATRREMILLVAEHDERTRNVSKFRRQNDQEIDIVCARDPNCRRLFKARRTGFGDHTWECTQNDMHTTCDAERNYHGRGKRCAYTVNQLVPIVAPMFDKDRDVKPKSISHELSLVMNVKPCKSLIFRVKNYAFMARYGMTQDEWRVRPEKLIAFCMGTHPRLGGGPTQGVRVPGQQHRGLGGDPSQGGHGQQLQLAKVISVGAHPEVMNESVSAEEATSLPTAKVLSISRPPQDVAVNVAGTLAGQQAKIAPSCAPQPRGGYTPKSGKKGTKPSYDTPCSFFEFSPEIVMCVGRAFLGMPFTKRVGQGQYYDGRSGTVAKEMRGEGPGATL